MDLNTIFNGLQDGLINQEDFFRKAMQNMLQEAIREEFKKFIGADEFERTEDRNGYRNGSYSRQLKTRVGSLELDVCRDREGKFQTELFERYQRSEKTFLLGLIDMFLNGTSTRKITDCIETLCGFEVSKSFVSEQLKKLDPLLNIWRERALKEDYVYLIFDARYEKIREGGIVLSKASVVAVGIKSDGFREIIGCGVFNSESKEAWEEFILSLKSRGLKGVRYVVSDDNSGLKGAISKHFQEALWQRCQVHFMRNFLGKLLRSEREEGMRLLKEAFSSYTREEALHRLERLKTFLESKKKSKVWNWIEEHIEETLAVFELPPEHRKKMKSTNMLERFNQELKRRSKVIRIFPNEESSLRLLTALCERTSEAWAERRYLEV